MDDPRDVTGVWYGSWSAEHPGVMPNSFIALLDEARGIVTGSVSEPDLLSAGTLLHARIAGFRGGCGVDWTKQYDGGGRLAHAVRYTGAIDDAGTQIEGRWRFAGYSGSFVMRRERFSAAELEAEEEALFGDGQ